LHSLNGIIIAEDETPSVIIAQNSVSVKEVLKICQKSRTSQSAFAGRSLKRQAIRTIAEQAAFP
jgi:hypothetical protein